MTTDDSVFRTYAKQLVYSVEPYQQTRKPSLEVTATTLATFSPNFRLAVAYLQFRI